GRTDPPHRPTPRDNRAAPPRAPALLPKPPPPPVGRPPPPRGKGNQGQGEPAEPAAQVPFSRGDRRGFAGARGGRHVHEVGGADPVEVAAVLGGALAHAAEDPDPAAAGGVGAVFEGAADGLRLAR